MDVFSPKNKKISYTFRPQPSKISLKKILIFLPKKPALKKFLIFSQKKVFSYISGNEIFLFSGKWNFLVPRVKNFRGELPSWKNKKIRPEKISYI